jgi:purine-binding chemotaxis protein CheW
VLPVVDIRRRFRLPEKNLTPDDQLIVAHSSDRLVVLVVDNVTDVIEYSGPDITSANSIAPGMEYIEGVARLKDGMILIHNLARFLSLDEVVALDHALESI